MNPDFFRVSLSGFTQKNYGKTHRRGNIDVVKENHFSVKISDGFSSIRMGLA